MKAPDELLYDSEASLRLVDSAIREVSSTTEVATHDILDGLARAVALVEQLDETPSPGIVATLRDELYDIMAFLQFQDITSQQLTQVTQLLEARRTA